MVAAVVFVLAQAATSPWVGPRPPECAALETGRVFNVWERAKTPRIRRYCDVLASGAAKLAASAAGADEALALAEEAAMLRPDQAAPRVLKGRALVQLGRHEDARRELEAARRADARVLDEPLTLLAWARALSFSGAKADALAAYRELLPRTTALPSAERTAAFVEAGALALASGPESLDDAVSCLRLALRDDRDGYGVLAPLLLALALDRAGSRDEAFALAAEHGGDAQKLDPQRLGASLGRRTLVPALVAELGAAVALALERTDRGAARAAWKKYLETAGAESPWATHARAHEAELAAGPRKASRPNAGAKP